MSRPITHLLLALVAIALVWLLVLPWASNTPVMGPIIERNEKAGIDPNALFYTDLELHRPARRSTR